MTSPEQSQFDEIMRLMDEMTRKERSWFLTYLLAIISPEHYPSVVRGIAHVHRMRAEDAELTPAQD